MLQWIRDVRQSIILQEFLGFAQISTTCVQVMLERLQFLSKLPLSLLLSELVSIWTLPHEGMIHSKVDVQVKLNFFCDNVATSKRIWHKPIPQKEKLFSLSRVEGFSHVLDASLVILDERLLKLAFFVVCHFVCEDLY